MDQAVRARSIRLAPADRLPVLKPYTETGQVQQCGALMLNDVFRWMRGAIFECIGCLVVTVFSLGFARTQGDKHKLTFLRYGIVRDADGKYVASSEIAKLIGALVFAAAFIATFMLLSDIPL